MASHPLLNWTPAQLRVIELRAQGLSVPKIAKQIAQEGFDLSCQTCYQIVREYAETVRENAVGWGEERFAEADARLEYLYAQIQERLAAAALNPLCDDGKFAGLVRAAVAVLDRQARLLGLDRTKALGGTGQHDWLDKTTPAQLAALAEKFDLKLPKQFVGNS